MGGGNNNDNNNQMYTQIDSGLSGFLLATSIHFWWFVPLCKVNGDRRGQLVFSLGHTVIGCGDGRVVCVCVCVCVDDAGTPIASDAEKIKDITQTCWLGRNVRLSETIKFA